MSSEAAILAQDVGKCYQIYDKPQHRLWQGVFRGRRQFYREFWALRDVSLEVQRGETVGIIGRNGSGKSTLLQIIAGTLAPSAGQVKVNGRIAALLELGSGFNPDFTGRENVHLNASILGLSGQQIQDRFDDIAAFADIGEFIDQPVKTYSSGMVVRLAFAVSVYVDAEVLIVDEALAVGDAGFQFKCLDRLKHLTDSGVTLLFVSHDVAMVKSFCDRALYLHQGQERAQGTPDRMAELYALDLRDDQRRWETGRAGEVRLKPLAGRDGGIAFGTDQGAITGARFAATGTQAATFLSGEPIEIEVVTETNTDLAAPCLSVLVQDSRMLNIGGRYFRLASAPGGSARAAEKFTIRFSPRLAAGRYFITLRLETRTSETIFMPVDKQVGALSFEILPSDGAFLGAVDLGLERI
jgi:lipopolysaccharide transport system ATP-binding protein